MDRREPQEDSVPLHDIHSLISLLFLVMKIIYLLSRTDHDINQAWWKGGTQNLNDQK